jgi:hypothetical protein
VAEILKEFLYISEVDWFRRRAEHANDWHEGRQGTGYEVLPLKKELTMFFTSVFVKRALRHIGEPVEDFWDTYLIRYPDGSSIPKHLDDASFGLRHRRLNAMVTAPEDGGRLTINNIEIPLLVGDAVLFYPNEEEHEVTTVRGTRLIFSVGAWLAV